MNTDDPESGGSSWAEPQLRRSRELIVRARLARDESRQLIARANALIPLYMCSGCGKPIDSRMIGQPFRAGACKSCGRAQAD